MQSIHYGAHQYQFGELHRASVRQYPGVVVVIHGGYWHTEYTLDLGRPLAEDLAAHGVDAWNIEYRRAEDDGGWPGTFADVSAAVDHLAELDVDTSRVVLVGHSAGGHLAVWAATRSALPAGAPGAHPRVAVTGVVSQAGVLDLALAQELHCGNDAVTNLLGDRQGSADERYWLADPAKNVPASAPVWQVYGTADDVVPPQIQDSYAGKALAAGGVVELVPLPGGHMELIDVNSAQWARCREIALAALTTASA